MRDRLSVGSVLPEIVAFPTVRSRIPFVVCGRARRDHRSQGSWQRNVTRQLFSPTAAETADSISQSAMDERTFHPSLGNEAGRTDTQLHHLIETGHLLGAETSWSGVIEAVLQAGPRCFGATVGDFFSNGVEGSAGANSAASEPLWLRGLSPKEGMEGAVLRPSVLFGGSWHPDRPIRSDDLDHDARVLPAGPKRGSPLRSRMRSYLAVPVWRSPESRFGVLVFGHTEPGQFGEEEAFALVLAAQAASALKNIELRETMEKDLGAAHAAHREAGRRLTQALEAAQLGTWSWNAASGLVDFDERAAELLGVPAGVGLPRNALRERLLNPQDLHRTPADAAGRG